MRQEHLDRLANESANRGVELETELHDDHVWLCHIERTTPRRGRGALIVQELLDLTDDWSMPVRCAVDASAEPLLEWYLGLGFEIETMSDLEGGRPGHALLIRYPEHVPTGARSFHLQEA